MAKKGNYEIPFNSKGDLLHYPENQWLEGDYRPPEWKPNFQFEDTLKIEDMARGRSAAYFITVSQTTGKKYPMFMKELHELLLATTVINGVVSGTWTFVKRGQNYGIQLKL